MVGIEVKYRFFGSVCIELEIVNLEFGFRIFSWILVEILRRKMRYKLEGNVVEGEVEFVCLLR